MLIEYLRMYSSIIKTLRKKIKFSLIIIFVIPGSNLLLLVQWIVSFKNEGAFNLIYFIKEMQKYQWWNYLSWGKRVNNSIRKNCNITSNIKLSNKKQSKDLSLWNSGKLNLFQANIPLQNAWKTSEDQSCSDTLSGVELKY